MTPTERTPKAAARARPSSDLRAYLLALLAAGYVVGWWRLGAPAAPQPARAAALPAVPEQHRTVWYGELPPAKRPVVRLPAGWRLAAPREAVVAERAAPARPVLRRASRRPGRVRTRSS